jgi:hypothetical protein
MEHHDFANTNERLAQIMPLLLVFIIETVLSETKKEAVV